MHGVVTAGRQRKEFRVDGQCNRRHWRFVTKYTVPFTGAWVDDVLVTVGMVAARACD